MFVLSFEWLEIKTFLFCHSSFSFKTNEREMDMLSCVVTQGPTQGTRLMGASSFVLLPCQLPNFSRQGREFIENSASLLCFVHSDIDYVYLYHSPLIRTCHMNLLDCKRSEFRGPQILDIWWASSCYFQPFDLWGHVTMFCYSELFIIGRKDKREERWERKKKENKQFRSLTIRKS